jgi:glycosyltransferase involved in cell wall biosynthesis
MKLPIISIVMPSLNQAQFLEQAIRSVLDQNHPEIELIVIDGGSSDNSVDILRAFENRIAYWVSEPDSGQSDALNKGIRRASGDIIGWLNSDDSYQPGVFGDIAAVFSDAETQIAMCRHFGLMDAEGRIFDKKENTYVDHRTLVRFWATNYMTINQPCVFFRSSVIDRTQPVFDTSLHYAMDYDLWLRITCDHPIRVIPGHWANYRFHETSKSGLGFSKFFPEWHEVSKRYWGEPHSFDWWSNLGNYCYHHYFLRSLRGIGKRVRETSRA